MGFSEAAQVIHLKPAQVESKKEGKRKESWREKESYHTAPDGLQEGI